MITNLAVAQETSKRKPNLSELVSYLKNASFRSLLTTGSNIVFPAAANFEDPTSSCSDVTKYKLDGLILINSNSLVFCYNQYALHQVKLVGVG